MDLIERSPSIESKRVTETGCLSKFISTRGALRTSKMLRLMRWTLAFAAFSALAACQQSSSNETTLSQANESAIKPAVTLVAIKSSVTMDTPATLQWSSQNAQSCMASGGWNGSQPISGSTTTGPLSAATSFTLTCTGPGGSTSQSAEVVVTSAAPDVSLAALPTTITAGSVSRLQWNSENATSCTASGGWSGPVANSGTWSTAALTNTTEYELTCTGQGGSATQTVTVTVGAGAPQISLSAEPSTVNAGGASVLTWSSQNASSCTAGGAWSGTKTLSGTQSTGALSANSSYTLKCTGPAGKASQTVSVSVKPAAPSVSIAVNPSTLASGASSTLAWSSLNASSCMASGAWSGSKPLVGSQSTGALSANVTYVLTCSNSGGSATQSATVSIKAPTPTVNLSVGPSAITSGGAATLNWSTNNATACSASGAWSGTKAIHGSQSTGTLSATSTYTLTCNGAGGTASQSATVSVKAAAPTVKISASPSSITSGSGSTLSWSATDATACTASGAWNGGKPMSGTQTTGNLTANQTYTLSCSGAGGTAVQSATISVKAVAPTVKISANPSSVISGSSSTLSWTATDATSCTASGAWSGSKPVTGSQSTGALKASGAFTLSCTGAGGSAAQSTTITVSTKPTATVSLSASPSSVASGASATLNWTSANATACTASGAWTGAKALIGTQSTGALKADSIFTLSCTGAGGGATQSATVTVAAAAPTVSISAAPSSVKSGGTAALTWSSTNATSCMASGAWSGAKALAGALSTGALKANETYTLTCKGAGGSAAQSATVSVSAAPPTVSFAATPSTVKSGAAATLTWSSANATACTASGAWSGSRASTGTQSTGALSANETYTLTCSGPGGSATQSASVSVTAPAATVTLAASPSTVASGAASTLTWSSSNATSCNASGAWTGALAINGTRSTGALKANATYTLTCSGSGGSASQSATVSVSSPAPIVKLAASPGTVASGAASTLTWSSTNSTSCTASGAWTGSKASAGSQSTGALKANSTYALTCSGPGGSAEQTATVSVTTPAPAITISATPSTVKSGATAVLKWSSSNATACTGSGGWTGAEATSGTRTTAALTATTKYTLSCSGVGGSASQTATVTVSAPAPSVSLSASPTSVTSGNASMLTWSSTNSTACTASGAWTGTEGTAGSKSTGALTKTSTFTVTCSGTGGTAAQSATVAVSAPVSSSGGTVKRPSYNTGDGFFVLNGKLYDANGNEFRIRGVDRCHYDSNSQAGIAKSGANTVRMFMGNLSGGAAKYVNVVQTQHIDFKEVPILTMPEFPDGTASTGNTDSGELSNAIDWWVANAATITPLDRTAMINIANEWGPANSAAWASAYEAGVAKLRAAGYLGTLVIDSGGWGQDVHDFFTYSTEVFNSDPQKNIVFSLHIYGSIATANVAPDLAQLAALSKSVGMVFIVGEFGPGRDIGPSPTMTTPDQIIGAAEANGIGWIAWAWDDNNLGGGASNDNWFSMTFKGPGVYTQTSDLTTFGQNIVLDPTYGLLALAKPATIF